MLNVPVTLAMAMPRADVLAADPPGQARGYLIRHFRQIGTSHTHLHAGEPAGLRSVQSGFDTPTRERGGQQDANRRVIGLHGLYLSVPESGPGRSGPCEVEEITTAAAAGIYERLARVLQPEGIMSLQVAYRRPARMQPCVEDTLTGGVFLESRRADRVALVGHSFGGAVVINAGAASRNVIAVAALSSQSYGAEGVRRLSPKAWLLAHGEADEVLPASCSVHMFEARATPSS